LGDCYNYGKGKGLSAVDLYLLCKSSRFFFDKYQLNAKKVWYEAPSYGFCGGFNLTGSMTSSVDRVIINLEENIAQTRQRWITTDTRERRTLKTLIDKQQMIIEAIQNGAVMLYGIEVEAELKTLYSLQDDSLISLVDVRHLPVTPGGVNGVQRPIQPAEKGAQTQ